MPPYGQRTSKWADDVANVVKADVRLHNAYALADDSAALFVVNRSTGIETVLVAAQLRRDLGIEARPVVPAGLLAGPLGDTLRAVGALSSETEGNEEAIVGALLRGTTSWVVFARPDGAASAPAAHTSLRLLGRVWPELATRLRKRLAGNTPPPGCRHPAALALQSEFYRHKIGSLSRRPYYEQLEKALRSFELESCDEALGKRTFLVPANVTCYPVRPGEGLGLSRAQAVAEADEATAQQGAGEGPPVPGGLGFDIRLGRPIDVRAHLERPDYAPPLASGAGDADLIRHDAKALLPQAVADLSRACDTGMRACMTVNCDHVFASLLRYQWPRTFSEEPFRARAFLCAHAVASELDGRLHGAFEEAYRSLLNGEPSRHFDDFLELCVHEGALHKHGTTLCRTHNAAQADAASGSCKPARLSNVIADELAPLGGAVRLVKHAARLPGPLVRRRARAILVDEDHGRFEKDYAAHYEEGATKEPAVGRPFLLKPHFPRAGVVLIHGYMAAPLEIRAMAQFLCRRGYAVYGVRLRGHGTSPSDLARSTWKDWYESVNHGFAIIRTITDQVVMGGFSMGAGLALLAAGRKRENVRAVFAVDAPLHLRSPAARLAPSVVRVNALLRKLHWPRPQWEYVANDPENRHINYTLNPVSGVAELAGAMNAMVHVLPDISAPTLILHGSGDPVVNPNSGQAIFDKVGTPYKELEVVYRDRHGIINGPGSEAVFERVCHFLAWARAIGRPARA